ncbi:MAG: Calx-beta domain-containing protein, partial [Gammaproteobacteria bacterium]
ARLTITDTDSTDIAWVDDGVPDGATTGASSNGAWNWVSTDPLPYSGTQAHQSALAAGFHQHYFYGVTPPLQVQTGDILYAYVYLDPANPPREVMLTWNAGVVGNADWHHRAYWGEDLIDKGVNGSPSRQYMGPLPPTGQWVRLEVPASAVGLEGAAVTGMSFNLYDGRATWDTAGITSTSTTAGLAEVAFSAAAYVISEAGPEAIITVDRTGGSSSSFTIDYASSGGTALAGVDYGAVSGTLSFADGEDSQTFSVPVFEDVLVEGDEQVVLTLSGGNGAIPGTVSQAMLTIADNDSTDFVWVDDALPDGATPGVSSNGAWNWVSTNPPPYSGTLAHKSALAAGLHQHYFFGVTTPLQVQTGDILYTYVYLDPANPPRELMLTWNARVVGNNDWHHRAYWGEDLIDKGVNGTPSRQYMGPLPPAGQWVRLEVPAGAVGLDGASITGMSFNLFDGRATWDVAGIISPSTL